MDTCRSSTRRGSRWWRRARSGRAALYVVPGWVGNTNLIDEEGEDNNTFILGVAGRLRLGEPMRSSARPYRASPAPAPEDPGQLRVREASGRAQLPDQLRKRAGQHAGPDRARRRPRAARTRRARRRGRQPVVHRVSTLREVLLTACRGGLDRRALGPICSCAFDDMAWLISPYGRRRRWWCWCWPRAADREEARRRQPACRRPQRGPGGDVHRNLSAPERAR